MSKQGSAAISVEVHNQAAVKERASKQSQRKRQPRYNVILWDDDDHSYDYVEIMMRMVFGHPSSMGHKIAQAVDSSGRATCLTTTLEHAELKRDQIHSFGRDALIERCEGSMSASIEPVPFD